MWLVQFTTNPGKFPLSCLVLLTLQPACFLCIFHFTVWSITKTHRQGLTCTTVSNFTTSSVTFRNENCMYFLSTENNTMCINTMWCLLWFSLELWQFSSHYFFDTRNHVNMVKKKSSMCCHYYENNVTLESPWKFSCT